MLLNNFKHLCRHSSRRDRGRQSAECAVFLVVDVDAAGGLGSHTACERNVKQTAVATRLEREALAFLCGSVI